MFLLNGLSNVGWFKHSTPSNRNLYDYWKDKYIAVVTALSGLFIQCEVTIETKKKQPQTAENLPKMNREVDKYLFSYFFTSLQHRLTMSIISHLPGYSLYGLFFGEIFSWVNISEWNVHFHDLWKKPCCHFLAPPSVSYQELSLLTFHQGSMAVTSSSCRLIISKTFELISSMVQGY